MVDRSAIYINQRTWRNRVIDDLKMKLGGMCHGCVKDHNEIEMAARADLEKLHLFIHNRRSEDLLKYFNNTISIYNHLLKGVLPIERVSLFCKDCRYKARRIEGLGLENGDA